MSFSIAYPSWFLLLCPLAGAIYALAFYYRDKRTEDFPNFLKWTMAFLRFAVVAFLVFLVLSPLIKSTKNTVEKPIIIIAQDNSASITTGKDSGFYKHDYPASWDKVISELSAHYDIRVMSFGNEVKDSMNYSFSEKETDISSVFDAINHRYYGKNLGAVFLATDGIYNKGVDPLYAARSLKCNIYTIALGDTTVKRDAIV
ncbi:MAG TPA: BatA domain-containing protein, partial [Bacteroidia bacterium]|nr:BatA domain-containing protein [Bacteroidia bacterium]